MSLLERAKLFVKLQSELSKSKINKGECSIETQSIKSVFNQTKFKTVRNTIISETTMPSKSLLVKTCKEVYGLDYTKLGLNGLTVAKDRVIMAIYIAEQLKQHGKIGL